MREALPPVNLSKRANESNNPIGGKLFQFDLAAQSPENNCGSTCGVDNFTLDLARLNDLSHNNLTHNRFFIHSGKTGELAKELLREYQISLLSGQRLVNFVLGLRLKILDSNYRSR